MNTSNMVGTTLVSYFSFAFLFFVVKARMGLTGMNHTVAILAFVFLTGILQWLSNVALSKKHCGTTDLKMVVYATVLPWLFILCTFTLAITAFPGWLRVFSNTIGAFILSGSGLTEIVTKLYEKHPTPTDENIVKMLGQIYTQQTALILELDIENVKVEKGVYTFPALEKLAELKILDGFESEERKPLKGQLFHKLLLKDDIGYFCWYVLVGVFFILVSMNTLLSETCNPKPPDYSMFKVKPL
jgi:hypothetical protein